MSRVGRNILWLLMSQIATWMATLFTLVIVPDRLGSGDFGAYGYAVGYVMFFTTIAGLGTSRVISRAIARDHELVGPYVWNGFILKLLLAAAMSALAFGLAYVFGNRGTTLTLIGIGCAGMLFQIVGEVFAGALGGLQRFGRFAVLMVLQVYFQTVVGIAVLLAGWGVVAYMTVMTIGTVIPTVAMAVIVWPLVRGHRVLDTGIWRLLVVGGIPLLALTFFSLVYGTISIPILHNLNGSEAVGWLLVAMRWVAIPIFITAAVQAAFFPVFSQHGNPMTPDFAPLVNQAILIVLLFTLPAATGLVLVADDLIAVAYSSGEFDSSAVLIQILALGMPLIALSTILGTAMVAADRVRRYLYVVAVAAFVNPIANIVLIGYTQDHFGNGAIGVAIVAVSTELWVTIGALHFRSDGVLDRRASLRVLRIGVASVAMVPILLLGSALPLVTKVLTGAVVFVVSSVAVRAVTLGELKQMVALVTSSRRAGGATTSRQAVVPRTTSGDTTPRI